MPDIVVTVPKDRWEDWIAEGDAVGETPTGEEWGYYVWADTRPTCVPGDRCYVVAHGLLRGFAPVVAVRWSPAERAWAICRRAGAEAVTIERPIVGFRGWRVRDWPREAERPFPDWMTRDVPPKVAARLADRDRRRLFP